MNPTQNAAKKKHHPFLKRAVNAARADLLFDRVQLASAKRRLWSAARAAKNAPRETFVKSILEPSAEIDLYTAFENWNKTRLERLQFLRRQTEGIRIAHKRRNRLSNKPNKSGPAARPR